MIFHPAVTGLRLSQVRGHGHLAWVKSGVAQSRIVERVPKPEGPEARRDRVQLVVGNYDGRAMMQAS